MPLQDRRIMPTIPSALDSNAQPIRTLCNAAEQLINAAEAHNLLRLLRLWHSSADQIASVDAASLLTLPEGQPQTALLILAPKLLQTGQRLSSNPLLTTLIVNPNVI
jgi:hypothetical protein